MEPKKFLKCTSFLAFFAVALWIQPAAAQDEINDQDLANAVEEAYAVDGAIDVNDVDISVNEGIVQLSGGVDNILAKDRATYIAERVKGVRAVSNTIKVQLPKPAPDEEIRKAIKTALLVDPATESYEVDVAVADGAVTLTGEVDSYGEKQLAGQVVKGVRGVKGLDNRLVIEWDSHRTDSEMQAEIEERFRWDLLLNDGLIDVNVLNARVLLTGAVGSAAERRRAGSNSWVAGVREVDASGLEVRWWAEEKDLREGKYVHKSDAEIRQAIEDAAFYDPRVYSGAVTPEVHNGWVTLRGTVRNLEAKEAAETLARHTVGTAGVINRLRIRPQSETSDSEIAENVERALAQNPYTDRFTIDVGVNQGEVKLTGTVGNPFERAEAGRIAAQLKGVVDVDNQLQPTEARLRLPDGLHFPWYMPAPPAGSQLNSDRQIESSIKEEYRWSPFVDPDQVTVEVNNGMATLSGTVDTWREFYAADENAREGGARLVINNLEVSHE